MAMNWGAFAGGAAGGALNTYSQLNSERLKNLQTALFMEDMADKQQMKQAAGETFGKVGKDQFENINSILEAKGAEVSPEAIAIEKPAAPVQYTEKQAVEDYGKRLSAIDPVRGFQFKGQALQIKTAQRQSDIDDGYDNLNKWQNGIFSTYFSTKEGKGFAGMPDALNPQLKEAGLSLEYKESKSGPGTLIVKDAQGKSVATYNSMDQVDKAFKDLVGGEYERRLVGLLGSADKALNYKLQRDKLEVDRQVALSTIARNQAQSGYYTNSLNALGAPIGTDSEGAPVYQSKNGPVYGNQTPVDPKAELTPWNQQRGFTPQLSTQNVTVKGPDGKDTIMPVQIVSSMGRDGVPTNKVYDLGGKLVDDPTIIKQIGVKQAPKELSPQEAAALKSYNDGVAELVKNGQANDKSVKELARILGVTHLVLQPGAVPTKQALDKSKPTSVADGGLGNPGGTPKADAGNMESPPTAAIPKEKPLSVGEQNVRARIAQIEERLPNMTPQMAREIQSSRGYNIIIPMQLRRKVDEIAKSDQPPPRTLYSPR